MSLGKALGEQDVFRSEGLGERVKTEEIRMEERDWQHLVPQPQ